MISNDLSEEVEEKIEKEFIIFFHAKAYLICLFLERSLLVIP